MSSTTTWVKRLVAGAAAVLAAVGAPAQSAINAESLAMLDSTFERCMQRDPKTVELFKRHVKRLTEGLGDAETMQLRQSDEYRQAYKQHWSVLQDTPGAEVAETCDALADWARQ
jgi:hypothetical protein